jgi:hypothetical protein
MPGRVTWAPVSFQSRLVGPRGAHVVGSLCLPTVASTAAKPGDNSRQVRTAVDHRSSTRPMPDNPGRRAHSHVRRSCSAARRAISGPLTPVRSGQPRPSRSSELSSSDDLTAMCNTPSKLVVPAACQNGAETSDVDQHQDDNETGPDQHRSSWVPTRNRHGKEKVYGSIP